MNSAALMLIMLYTFVGVVSLYDLVRFGLYIGESGIGSVHIPLSTMADLIPVVVMSCGAK